MTLREHIIELEKEGYVVIQDSLPVFTNKALRELNNPGSVVALSRPLFPASTSSVDTRLQGNPGIFRKFIQDAKVPFRVTSPSGSTFTASAVSKPGTEAFMKVFNNPAINYANLVLSTQLYYKQKQNIVYLKKIGNYFIEGDWEVYYEQFVKSLSDGSIEDLVTKTINPNPTNMRLGN